MRNTGTHTGKRIRLFLTAALTVSLLLTAGCGRGPSGQTEPETTAPIGSTEATEKSEPHKATEPAQTTEPTLGTEATAKEYPTALRQAMIETPQVMAVAYFGLIDYPEPEDIFAVMQASAPQLCQNQPFLLTIPEENIVGGGAGDLFCIVPRDDDASVSIYKGVWGEDEGLEYTDEIYHSESGEPILLFCNNAGWEPDTQVVITNSDGSSVIWYPQLDDTFCVDQLLNDDWEEMIFDFSPYVELLAGGYFDRIDAGWMFPTAEGLTGTSWGTESYLKDGRYVTYLLTFNDKTVDVRWNDGIDEEDHEYSGAAYELTYDEGFAILTIDFREFAGEMRFNLLVNEELGILYTMMDVSSGDVVPGWEPLYRCLSLVP